MSCGLRIILVICTYNNAVVLRQTLASIEEQKVNDNHQWSVVVVDNNSQDDTEAVVREYQNKGHIPSLKRIFEPRQGLAFARRTAVRARESDLIAFVDDDCILDPQWVNQAACFFAEHEKAGALGGRIDIVWETEPPKVLSDHAYCFAAQDYGNVPRSLASEMEMDLAGAGLVLKRKALLKSGWCENFCLVGRKGMALGAGDDIEMILRIRNSGYEIWYSPTLRLKHFIPARRISVNYFCKLHRGFGRSYPFLLALDRRIGSARRARVDVAKTVLMHVRGYYRCVTLLQCLRPERLSDTLRIQLYYFLGMLEGCASFLIRGHNP